MIKDKSEYILSFVRNLVKSTYRYFPAVRLKANVYTIPAGRLVGRTGRGLPDNHGEGVQE